jgi:hypothetical protein
MLNQKKSKTRMYNIWSHMKARCFRKTHSKYKNWGGRGITVCERWLNFENFLSDMGEAPKGLSIERIDNDGNYEPSNCRWATIQEQNKNRTTKRLITANGKTQSVIEWCQELGVKRSFLNSRIIRNWTDDEIINNPKKISKNQKKRNEKVERKCDCGKIDLVNFSSFLDGTLSKFCRSCRSKMVREKTYIPIKRGAKPYSKA